MTERLRDWRARLTEYLADWERVPFAYGTRDCWLFAMGAAEAVTGLDYIGTARGYDSLESGLAAIKDATGRKGYVDFVYRTFGKLPSVWMAIPGDIATVDTQDGIGLGVVQGEGIYMLSEHNGWFVIPLEQARGCYAVGSKDRS